MVSPRGKKIEETASRANDKLYFKSQRNRFGTNQFAVYARDNV